MTALLRFPWPYPPRGTVLVLLCALYLLPGLIGHGPWKADDATHFGIVYSMLESERAWLPQLAGEPLPQAPPLFYWLSVLLGGLLQAVLPLHDAVRLTTGVAAIAMLAGLSLAARRLHGDEQGSTAPLITIGCLGLLVHIHDTQPSIAFLAAGAFALFGLALIPERRSAGMLVTGGSIGLGFLSAGWTAALTLVPLALIMPLAGRPWRRPAALAALLGAVAIAALIGSAWPVVLGLSGGKLLAVWLIRSMEELNSLSLTLPRIGGYLAMLPWFAWPALPLALWALWQRRSELLRPAVLLPLVAFVVFLLGGAAADQARSLTALPLLLPLVLLAAISATELRRGAANAFDWFAMMTFTLFAALIWLAWVAMLTGWPAQLAKNISKLEPGFVFQPSWWATLIALLATSAWFWLLASSPRSPVRGTVHWAAGMALLWMLTMLLLLPWIDYGRSYRQLALSLQNALPATESCIARSGLSDAQRASFYYFIGLTTVPLRSAEARECRLLLLQGPGRRPETSPGAAWRKLWEGRRPGDRNEIFRLYRKE